MFANNTSEMKRLAARDYEDILQVPTVLLNYYIPSLLTASLQCAIPVFEGLFPASHDMVVQSLLFRFAQWHALAKLRIHSESTLFFFEDTFKKLSKQLRNFRDFTCAVFNTVELPKEKAARPACWTCQYFRIQRTKGENIQFEHLQVPCNGRLPANHQALRYYRLVHHPGCKHYLDSPIAQGCFES